MGSIAYAIGGALEGAGKGGAEIGSEMAQGDMHSAILRMQHKFALQQQQAGFAFERGMSKQKEAQELRRLGISMQGGVLAQGRAQAFQAAESTKQRQTQLETARIRASGQVEAASERKGAGAANQDKWQHVPSGQSIPNPGGGPDIMTNQPLLMSPHGRLYAQVGQDLVPYDYTKRGPMDLKTGNNGKPFDPQTAEARRALLADPTKVMPSGISARDYYESRYGALPIGFNDAYDRASGVGQPGTSASTSAKTGRPKPTGYNPSSAGEPTTAGNADAQEKLQQQIDQQRQDAEDAADREFSSTSSQNSSAGGLEDYQNATQ